jgi:hypothetical protein
MGGGEGEEGGIMEEGSRKRKWRGRRNNRRRK